MVRELTELQGTMGGIYAREEGLPAEVWRAIYFHYLPIGVEADAPPSKQQLGPAAATWAAVSLADKLDSLAGMFTAGERPTGSRDPLALRRQAQGVVKILADLPEVTGLVARVGVDGLLEQAAKPFGGLGTANDTLVAFMRDRLGHLLEQRGYDVRIARAVTFGAVVPLDARRKAEALAQMSGSPSLVGVATLLKRVKNITKGIAQAVPLNTLRSALSEPAELQLASDLSSRQPAIVGAAERGDYREAFTQIAQLQPAVAKFFDDVLVMAEDETVRTARLALVATLRDLILSIADLSEIAAEKDT
jgi:glycyl-tRNA synthetase beta chain